jgi:hypothetical protein
MLSLNVTKATRDVRPVGQADQHVRFADYKVLIGREITKRERMSTIDKSEAPVPFLPSTTHFSHFIPRRSTATLG